MRITAGKEKAALVTLASCMTLASLGTSIANVALPQLSRAFSADFADAQWIIITYLIANTVFIVVAGRLGDLFGRQKILRIGIMLFVLSSFVCALSQSLGMIIIGRALQGIGAATLMSLTIALVTDLFAKDRIGRVMGILGTASAVGTAGGPSIGGFLLSLSGWPSIFLLLGSVAACVLFISFKSFPVPVSDESGRSKNKHKTGFIKLNLRSFVPGLLMNMCVSMVMMSTLVAGPFYLSEALQLKPLDVGLVMTTGPLASILSGIPAGRTVDRYGPSKVIVLGLLSLIVGCASFALLPSKIGVAGYMLSAAVLSPGYQMFQAANNSGVMVNVSEEQKGTVSGLLSFSRNTGLILGASLMGTLFSRHGLEVTFLAAAMIAFMALGIAMMINAKRSFV